SGGLVVRAIAFYLHERGFDPRLGEVRSFVTILHRNRPIRYIPYKKLPIAMVLMTRLPENFCRSYIGINRHEECCKDGENLGRVRRWDILFKGGGNGGG
ncbi:hypothetical protein AVEN_4922-1, partial [Araneus ventricosus]